MAKTSKKVLYDFMQKLAVKSNQPTLAPIEEINEVLFQHVDGIVFNEYYIKWLSASDEDRIIQEKEMNERIILLMGIYNSFV